MPRPTRFLFLFAFFGARRFDKFISVLAQRRPESHRPTRMMFCSSCFPLAFGSPVARPLLAFR
jgi:hypothetical protein